MLVSLGDAEEGLDLVLGEVLEGEADDVREERLLAAPDAPRGDGNGVGSVDDGEGACGALGPPAVDGEAHAACGEVDDLAAVAEEALDGDALGDAALAGRCRCGGVRGGGGAREHDGGRIGNTVRRANGWRADRWERGWDAAGCAGGMGGCGR